VPAVQANEIAPNSGNKIINALNGLNYYVENYPKVAFYLGTSVTCALTFFATRWLFRKTLVDQVRTVNGAIANDAVVVQNLKGTPTLLVKPQ